MKTGEFLIAKSSFNIPTWNRYTKEQMGGLEIEQYERCEIIKINRAPESTVEVKCRNEIIGFSLTDANVSPFEFYQKFFYDYNMSKYAIKEIRRKKLQKIWK